MLSGALCRGRWFGLISKPDFRAISMAVNENPIENAIRAGLTKELKPVHLDIVNESYMHNVPKGSETHFKVLVVSQQFEGLPLIKRHRLVNDIVKTQLAGDFVHALSIVAKTPQQWDEAYKLEPSPNCKGGFGK
ncbi:bolA-like protein DDB_G0274169 [Anopheles maculipalpis]|uniref:bolA-like protein DDB_G0274169 n=1 Tax=Anopheles maculipalpis TaxID=1496333 RepID=UPI002158F083|nr:bolA-like protein DDB_G0274169 [Anopheles maculipalpis]